MPARALPNPLRGLVSLFYPAYCALCSTPVERDETLCCSCLETAPRIRAPFCAKCSQPFPGAISDSFTCANCENRVLHFDAAVSAFRSRGVVRKVMHDFKYGRQLHLRHLLGHWLAETMNDPRLAGRRFNLIVPVPLHPARKRERGFNQAELLALELHRRPRFQSRVCCGGPAIPPPRRSSIAASGWKICGGRFVYGAAATCKVCGCY